MKTEKKHPWLKTMAQEVHRAKQIKEKRAKTATRQRSSNFQVDFSQK